MIIDESIDNYRALANNQIAVFKVDFIQSFWKKMPDLNIEDDNYFKINQALGDSVEKLIEHFYVVSAYDYKTLKSMPEKNIDINVINDTAKAIADNLIKNDKIKIRKTKTLMGGLDYHCSIAFIKDLRDLKKE